MSAKATTQPGPFRIHVVAQMTGVPEPTLRAWERRYGIPTPERTASGYRLYGAREVDQVRRMRELCDGGMSAAEAARTIDGERREHAIAPAAPGAHDPDVFAQARDGLLDAIGRFDADGLEARTRALSVLASPVTLLDEVIAPVLREVGDRWHAGDLSVGQEHMASHVLASFLVDLLRLASAGARTPALLASFADDEHQLAPLALGLRLAGWGLRPIVLGARTPPAAVRDAVRAVRPSLVALSVTIAPAPSRARELVDDYAAACGHVPWIVGGAGASALAEMVRAAGGAIDPNDPDKLRAFVEKALRPRTRR